MKKILILAAAAVFGFENDLQLPTQSHIENENSFKYFTANLYSTYKASLSGGYRLGNEKYANDFSVGAGYSPHGSFQLSARYAFLPYFGDKWYVGPSTTVTLTPQAYFVRNPENRDPQKAQWGQKPSFGQNFDLIVGKQQKTPDGHSFWQIAFAPLQFYHLNECYKTPAWDTKFDGTKYTEQELESIRNNSWKNALRCSLQFSAGMSF